MSGTIKFAFSLHKPIFDAFENAPATEKSNGRALMRDVLNRYAIDNLNPGETDLTFDLELYRSLTQEVADAAARIIADHGWREDITLRAIQDCQSRPDWISGYQMLINDDPFVSGNKIKSSVNQNFGQYVKIRLNARNKTDGAGNRVTLQVSGELVRSVTLLLPS